MDAAVKTQDTAPPSNIKVDTAVIDKPYKKPTIWRIIRAYLNVRETAKTQDIFDYIQEHRKSYSKEEFYRKMSKLKSDGLVKSAAWGTYTITQKGRSTFTTDADAHEDVFKPVEARPGDAKTISTVTAEPSTKTPDELRAEIRAKIHAQSAKDAVEADDMLDDIVTMRTHIANLEARLAGYTPAPTPTQDDTENRIAMTYRDPNTGMDVVINLKLRISVELA